MTRSRIGVFLLVLLFLLGILVQREMESIHRPIAGLLDLSAEDALAEDWASAGALADKANARWQKYWRFSAALADHAPMEDIDALFARLEVAADQKDALEYASACRELARRIGAVAEAHALNWWNLL